MADWASMGGAIGLNIERSSRNLKTWVMENKGGHGRPSALQSKAGADR